MATYTSDTVGSNGSGGGLFNNNGIQPVGVVGFADLVGGNRRNCDCDQRFNDLQFTLINKNTTDTGKETLAGLNFLNNNMTGQNFINNTAIKDVGNSVMNQGCMDREETKEQGSKTRDFASDWFWRTNKNVDNTERNILDKLCEMESNRKDEKIRDLEKNGIITTVESMLNKRGLFEGSGPVIVAHQPQCHDNHDNGNQNNILIQVTNAFASAVGQSADQTNKKLDRLADILAEKK